ncbi:hypothetical protein OG949_41325 (plasmid) [Streptomyces scopuliridis]|uniref:hypothetical protein n=1 Tax=Streptomyces scopuliridis TaxID=452529 RepID=UPI002DD856BE|nr:hypothetical protein [Streptomyces scopuliridis]WSB39185.1 hypothetical protein OG949_41325 [Streptomyces scopuliridis]
MLTHAAANLPLPDDSGPTPRPGSPPATPTASTLSWRGKAATVIPGLTVTANDAPFHVNDHESYAGPHGADLAALLADAVAGVSA